jgi:NtrC-family two-component system sensor histidine kinase KinB
MTARLRPSEQTRASLDLLYSISRELAGQLNLRDLLQRILQLTLENVGAPSGSILVLDERGRVTEGALAFGGKVHDHTAEQLTDTYERGLAGWVVEHRRPAVVTSTRDDPRWLQRDAADGDGESRSAICVPLMARDRVAGVLTLVHPEADHFSQDNLSLLSVIADQAGIAVENARLFAAERERRRFASTLQEIARTISSTLDPAQVLPAVLTQLERVVEYDSASIFVLERDRLRLVAARGFRDDQAALGTSMPVDPDLLTGRVLTTRQPVVVADVQQEPGWLEVEMPPEARAIRGWIGAPLVVRDHAVGVLNVDSHKVGAYGPDEVEVVASFADQAATAVANAQLFAERQRQMQAMVALAEAAHAVTASLRLDEVLERILDQTMRSLDVEAASLAMVDEATGELEFKVAKGMGASQIVGSRLAKGEGIAGWVLANNQPLMVPKVQIDPRFSREMDSRTGFTTRALACAPIRLQDRSIGVLEAVNPHSGEFQPEQVDLLVGIAGLAGTAIAHAKLFEETQAAHQRYAGLFEDSIDPILISDLDGIITDANARAEAFLGYDRDELRGKAVLSLHVPDSTRAPADPGALAAGEAISYTGRATHKDGQPLPVEVHIKRVDIARQPILQWILRDISERLALDELRADLTSMIFHDLRSPLGNVISSLEVLQTSLPADDEALQSVLAIAVRSSRRLSRLVESLLDLGQLEAGQAVLHKAQGSISALIAEAVEEIHPMAEAKGHMLQFSLEPAGLPTVEMDVDMIRRVLINLLENAVKYTRSGGRISISADRTGDEVRVKVSDTGPGIPAGDQQRIFEKFARLQHEGRAKGLGLGLAFCRLAVGAHGGRIWVESQVGQGSTFSFTLPL